VNHSKIRNINLTYDKVVVGSTLEALLYCYLNNTPFIFVELERPNRFDYFNPNVDLSFFGLENISTSQLRRVENGMSTSNKLIGISKDILWEKLYFYLTLAGLNPIADKASSIKLVTAGKLKVFTHKARMATISFKELIIFSDEGVSGLPLPVEFPEKKYKVYDWFDVRSGMKHDHDFLEDDNDFVKQILFYPTDRIDGEHNLKDAVAISYLSEWQLDDFDYSDINARFKTLYMMKKAGIRGTRNGRDMNDKTKFKYYAVKIENSHRELELLTKPSYQSTASIKFNTSTFDDIIRKHQLLDSYVARIF